MLCGAEGRGGEGEEEEGGGGGGEGRGGLTYFRNCDGWVLGRLLVIIRNQFQYQET